MKCPLCCNELTELKLKSKDYIRGMTHKCENCNSVLLVIIEGGK